MKYVVRARCIDGTIYLGTHSHSFYRRDAELMSREYAEKLVAREQERNLNRDMDSLIGRFEIIPSILTK